MTHEYKDQPPIDLENGRKPRMFMRRESDRKPPGGLTGSTIVALVLQAAGIIITLVVTMRSGEMSILRRLDEVKEIAEKADQHALSVMKDLEGHIVVDHAEKDKARILLHNSCMGAQNKGCHPSVILGRQPKFGPSP